MTGSTKNHYNAIVIGVGSMGAATCFHLAEAGQRVLGLDQSSVPHTHGSHGGQSRIFRKAYFEHPDYVPLLEDAYTRWKALSNESPIPLFYETGIAYFAPPKHQTLQGVSASSARHGIPLSVLDQSAIANRFQQFNLPEQYTGLFEPASGYVLPEATIELLISKARVNGATILTGVSVLHWKREGKHVTVTTSQEQYTCDKLVITAGSWSAKLIPALKDKLTVTQQHLIWVEPEHPEEFMAPHFPCWFIEDEELGMFYGFPYSDGVTPPGPRGLKLANHRPGIPVDPDRRGAEDYRRTRELTAVFFQRYLPRIKYRRMEEKSCLYTYSEDEHFIIDFLPGSDERVVIACGFSGHGFKFVPTVGKILADLALHGKTELPIALFSASRLR